MKGAVFKLDNEYKGYAEDGTNSYFEIAEALEIMYDYNKSCTYPIEYSEQSDSFWQVNQHTIRTWKGKNYETENGIKHLYKLNLQWEAIEYV